MAWIFGKVAMVLITRCIDIQVAYSLMTDRLMFLSKGATLYVRETGQIPLYTQSFRPTQPLSMYLRVTGPVSSPR